MSTEVMSVTEIDYVDRPEAIRSLFREYHEWMKQGVIESIGGRALPAGDIEQAYDIEALISEDVAYLAEPATDGRLFIARRGGSPIGCVFLRWRSEATAEVKRLYVRPEARGVGLGRSLMEAVIDAAEDDGCTTLVIFTAPFTGAARALYEDLGFAYTTPFDCEAPEEVYGELVFMRLDLGAEGTAG